MTVLRVATYNIHKGVQGIGPARRLEIHNLGHAVEQLDADIVCLQEVRKLHRREAQYFAHWPELPQAEFLAPEGYTAIYKTNAHTRHGEHGNAMLSRWPVVSHQHEDMSDHRFEQRGLLHSEVTGAWGPGACGGGSSGSDQGQPGAAAGATVRASSTREIPANAPVLVAGDFNDWGVRCTRRWDAACSLRLIRSARPPFPRGCLWSSWTMFLQRGLKPLGVHVPRGRIWGRMSDHLPLIAEFDLPLEATLTAPYSSETATTCELLQGGAAFFPRIGGSHRCQCIGGAAGDLHFHFDASGEMVAAALERARRGVLPSS
jgi:endonuclease/exonuclease/phosphatase family metal-dependent hydrolase